MPHRYTEKEANKAIKTATYQVAKMVETASLLPKFKPCAVCKSPVEVHQTVCHNCKCNDPFDYAMEKV